VIRCTACNRHLDRTSLASDLAVMTLHWMSSHPERWLALHPEDAWFLDGAAAAPGPSAAVGYPGRVARYVITFILPAAEHAEPPAADRLARWLLALPPGPVRNAQLVSRSSRRLMLTSVKIAMTVTAPDIPAATALAHEALTTAMRGDEKTWDLDGLTAEIRPAPVRAARSR
jgi:hypothetical protein